MVKKWAAKYQAEMNESWQNEGVDSGARTDGTSETTDLYTKSADTVSLTVQFYDDQIDRSPISEVYIENAATPVAITDHQYYQAVDDHKSSTASGKILKYAHNYVLVLR